MTKTRRTLLTIFADTFQCLFQSFYSVQMRFGLKLISVTDELFLQRFRQIVLHRDRNILINNILS